MVHAPNGKPVGEIPKRPQAAAYYKTKTCCVNQFPVFFGATYFSGFARSPPYEFGHGTDRHGRYGRKHRQIRLLRDPNPMEYLRPGQGFGQKAKT